MSYRPGYTVTNVAVDVFVDVDGLNDIIQLYVKAFGGRVAKFLKSQARLLCQDMLDYTVPFSPDPPTRRAGRNAMARLKGVKSMESDIDRVFQPLARAGWADIAAVDDFGIFNTWLSARRKEGYSIPSKFEGGNGSFYDWQAFQDKWRGEEGFFHEDQKPDFSAVRGGSSIESAHNSVRIKGSANYKRKMKHSGTVFLVADMSDVASYKKRVGLRVGKLKAGWYSAGMAVNDGKLSAPAWIIGNQWGTGTMENRLSQRPVMSITIGNKAHPQMTTEPGYSMWKYAVSHRAYVIRETIARKLSNSKPERVEKVIKDLENTNYFEIEQDPF